MTLHSITLCCVQFLFAFLVHVFTDQTSFILLNVQKYTNSLTQHRRTRNLNASVYILSINWYIRSNCEMWQHIGSLCTAEGVGARYRRNIQQYLLILIYTYGTQLINWRKNEEGSKILNWVSDMSIEIPCPFMLRQWVEVFLDV